MSVFLPADYALLRPVECHLSRITGQVADRFDKQRTMAHNAHDLGAVGFYTVCIDTCHVIVDDFAHDDTDTLFNMSWTYWDNHDIVEDIFTCAYIALFEYIETTLKTNLTISSRELATKAEMHLYELINEPQFKTLQAIHDKYGLKTTPEDAKDVIYPHRAHLGRGHGVPQKLERWS